MNKHAAVLGYGGAAKRIHVICDDVGLGQIPPTTIRKLYRDGGGVWHNGVLLDLNEANIAVLRLLDIISEKSVADMMEALKAKELK